ncbi:MAG: site-specific integrase [Planctomycetes bacterium]|nr:site-specific integrase [Planctomycetota bacterium]
MASIFKQQYTAKDKNGDKIKKKSKFWYIDYKSVDGIRKRVKGYKDKGATMQLAAKLEREVELAEVGIIDKYAKHRKKALLEHLKEFRQSLLDKGNTAKHSDLTYKRAKSIIEACKFVFTPDLNASKVQSFLAQKRKVKINIRTSNHYLRTIKQFCAWLVADGRMGENPLAYLGSLNPKTDIRLKRRALTPEEMKTLINYTMKSGLNKLLTGKERTMLYILAANTGFRVRELTSLTWQSFDFDDKAPTITVEASYSKHRREDVLPLRQDVASLFREWKEARKETDKRPVFNSSGSVKWAAMLKRDLKAAGIDCKDEAGRVVDFHALRHTYITNLIKGGASPKVAQALARHSNITLTMDVYTHLTAYDERKGLSALPDIPIGDKNDSEQNCEVQIKTGTDNMPVRIDKSLTHQLTKTPYFDSDQPASFGIKSGVDNSNIQTQGNDCKAIQNNTLGNDKAPLSLVVNRAKQRISGISKNTTEQIQQPQRAKRT